MATRTLRDHFEVKKAQPRSPRKSQQQQQQTSTSSRGSSAKVAAATSSAEDVQAQAQLSALKTFDLDMRYGPCAGMTRLERWQRAKDDGLNPPAELPAIITSHSDDVQFTESLWFGRI
eukprot:m.213050 g.213050  ORF g.213050 m.213050 type:complete len:118 (-) comp22691_c0_seq1:220-573(-)